MWTSHNDDTQMYSPSNYTVLFYQSENNVFIRNKNVAMEGKSLSSRVLSRPCDSTVDFRNGSASDMHTRNELPALCEWWIIEILFA